MGKGVGRPHSYLYPAAAIPTYTCPPAAAGRMRRRRMGLVAARHEEEQMEYEDDTFGADVGGFGRPCRGMKSRDRD